MAVAAPKCVAIIGGGVSGLAAYRHITLHPALKATLFEASSTLGGLWSSEHPFHRPDMTANVSRHTETLSDMPWPNEIWANNRRDAFPRARDIGRYLKLYADRHLRKEDVRLSTKVTKVEHREGKWHVTSNDLKEGTREVVDEFDYLVIASGFFSAPYTPRLPGVIGARVEIQHSADFSSPESYIGKNVALIGGSHSAMEIAGLLVPYAAKIHHVHPKPFFAISRYLPTSTIPVEKGKPNFLPLDLVFNRRSTRPNMDERLLPTPDMNRSRNAFLSSLFPLSCFSVDPDKPQNIGISDQYIAGARAGVIVSHLARLDSISQEGTLELSSGEQICTPNVVIFCTGYRTLLPFLSASLQDDIGYRADDVYVPLLADHLVLHPKLPNAGFVGMYRGPYFAVVELQARYLAALFAGKTEWPCEADMDQGIALEARLRESDRDCRTQFPHGDYGGMMENYARLLGLTSHSSDALESTGSSTTHRAVDDLFLAVNYPLSRTLDVKAIESDALDALRYSLRGGWVSAAVFYSLCGRWKLHRTICHNTSSGMDGTFEGVATFYPRRPSVLPKGRDQLPSLETSISSSCESRSSHLTQIIANSAQEEAILEYLYHEHGTFTTSTGISFQAHRKYIYRYQSISDTISVWFCKGAASAEAPDYGELDYWFHDIAIEGSDASVTDGSSNDKSAAVHEKAWFKKHQQKGGWTATGTEHLCVRDFYRPIYKFCFEGAELREFGIGYDVEGPEKRYLSEAWYERK